MGKSRWSLSPSTAGDRQRARMVLHRARKGKPRFGPHRRRWRCNQAGLGLPASSAGRCRLERVTDLSTYPDTVIVVGILQARFDIEHQRVIQPGGQAQLPAPAIIIAIVTRQDSTVAGLGNQADARVDTAIATKRAIRRLAVKGAVAEAQLHVAEQSGVPDT